MAKYVYKIGIEGDTDGTTLILTHTRKFTGLDLEKMLIDMCTDYKNMSIYMYDTEQTPEKLKDMEEKLRDLNSVDDNPEKPISFLSYMISSFKDMVLRYLQKIHGFSEQPYQATYLIELGEDY